MAADPYYHVTVIQDGRLWSVNGNTGAYKSLGNNAGAGWDGATSMSALQDVERGGALTAGSVFSRLFCQCANDDLITACKGA